MKFKGKSGIAWALTRLGGVARNADSRIPALFDTFDEALYCLRPGERVVHVRWFVRPIAKKKARKK